MTQEAEVLLRKSLDDVNRTKKRQILAFIILFIAVMICILWLGRVSENPATDVRRMLFLSVGVLLFMMAYAATAVTMVVTKMTTKVLKAIELASNGYPYKQVAVTCNAGYFRSITAVTLHGSVFNRFMTTDLR